MAYELSDVLLPAGENNIPGLAPIGYFFRKSDIETWPTPPKSEATATTLADTVAYTGDFEFKVGKKMNAIYGTQGKGKLDFSKQGEVDSESFLNKAHFMHPTLRDEMMLFSSQAKEDLVFIFKEIDSGKYRLVGHPDFRAVIKIEGTSGDASTSAIGVTVDIEVTSKWALPEYKGTIVTTPAV